MKYVSFVKITTLVFVAHIVSSQNRVVAHSIVRTGEDISAYEKEVLDIRYPLIKETFQKFVGSELSDQHIPSMAVVTSGGGCRASIASLACTHALEDMGFLDACSHVAALSGSTWMLGSLLANNSSLPALKVRLQNSLRQIYAGLEIGSIFEHLKSKAYTSNQSITLTDVYGSILAHIFLKNFQKDGQSVCLSDVLGAVSSGKYPFPLLSAALDVEPREFIEISPWEVGSADYLRSWVRTDAFGSAFDQGISGDVVPEQSLGFFMGVCGSYVLGYPEVAKFVYQVLDDLKRYWAFVSAPSSLDDYQKHVGLLEDLNSIHYQLGSKNLQNFCHVAARVNNFTKNIEHSPVRDCDELVLVDGALICNLPFAPLLIPARNINLYLVCDISGGSKSEIIQRLEEYAERKKYRLPVFDHKKIENNEPAIFYDEHDSKVPVIVYIPHAADFSTLKFQYSEQEFDELYESMKNLVFGCRDLIIQAMNLAVENTKKRTDSMGDDVLHEHGDLTYIADNDHAVAPAQNFDDLYNSIKVLPQGYQAKIVKDLKAALEANGVTTAPDGNLDDLYQSLNQMSLINPNAIGQSIEKVKSSYWCTIL